MFVTKLIIAKMKHIVMMAINLPLFFVSVIMFGLKFCVCYSAIPKR